MLKVEGLTKRYGALEVLKGISFEVEKGIVYGFLGRNGAGKTTTMNILTGLINFNDGSILYNDRDFRKNKRSILSSIGYVPQEPVFYGYMNAIEYLRFMGELSGMDINTVKRRIGEVLDIVGLSSAAKRKVGGYSGGMKQRFAIAVALFNSPQMLFLDEPTSSLDPEGRMEILKLIEVLKNQGMTIFFSTHILNDAERVCDQLSILEAGSIMLSSDLNSLRHKYIKPIYDIEAESDSTKLINYLKGLPWVYDILLENNKISVYVKDIDISKREIIKALAETDCTVISLNLRKSNLEDIFIRLVNNNENL